MVSDGKKQRIKIKTDIYSRLITLKVALVSLTC